MNKKLYIVMSILAAATFTATLKAEAKGCCCVPPTHSMKPRFYLDVGVGHAFDSQANSDAIAEPDIVGGPIDILYSLSEANHAKPDNLLIGAGFLWSDLHQTDSPYFPFLSLGLQYQYTNFDNKKTSMRLNISDINTGEVVLSPEASYVFSQNSLLANLKLDLYRWDRVMPYVNLGLGASWNQAKDKTPFTLFAGKADLITGTTRNTSFSYNLGAGLDFLITERFWLSLGYNYNNFGRVSINKFLNLDDPSFSGPADFKFNLGNLATHNIQLTGRYVFG